MSLDIPADLQPFVDQQLKLGCFDSEQQIVAEGLRRLKADHEESVAGVQAGLADATAGRVQPLRDAFADLRKELGIQALQ